jgi:hypothetical protein
VKWTKSNWSSFNLFNSNCCCSIVKSFQMFWVRTNWTSLCMLALRKVPISELNTWDGFTLVLFTRSSSVRLDRHSDVILQQAAVVLLLVHSLPTTRPALLQRRCLAGDVFVALVKTTTSPDYRQGNAEWPAESCRAAVCADISYRAMFFIPNHNFWHLHIRV